MRIFQATGAPFDPKHEGGSIMVQDPVCLRKFDLDDAVACIDYGGWAYFFCSDTCREQFRVEPKRYGREPLVAISGSSGSNTPLTEERRL